MEIRRLIKEDKDRASALLARAFEEMRDIFYPGDLVDEFLGQYAPDKLEPRFDLPRYIGIGAFEDKNMMALAWGWDDGTKVFILDWIVVAPEKRGQGIGRAVMRTLEEELAFQGFFKLFLQSSTKNIPAIKRYLHMGYKIEGVHPNHHFGWDFLSFGKVLNRKTWSGPVLSEPTFEIEDLREIYGYGD